MAIGIVIPTLHASEFIATEKRRIAGQEVNVNHYKLTGKVNVDLWYDGAGRLKPAGA